MSFCRTDGSDSSMLYKFYEVEKQKLEHALTQIMERDSPMIMRKRGNKHPSQQELTKKKQLVIDALLQIRGRAQLKHEESLKKQQEVLILTTDNAIKKETEIRREEFFRVAEEYTTSRYYRELSRVLSNGTVTVADAPPNCFSSSRDDEQHIVNAVNETVVQIEQILQTYIARKKKRALQAMNAELQSLSAMSISGVENISREDVKGKLQEDIRSLMTEGSHFEESYWKAKLGNNNLLTNNSVASRLRSLLVLHKKNLQLAAQICVLRELKEK